MTMDMIPLESSFIAAIGHDPDTATLRVQFKNGSTFDYAGVTDDLFEDMQTAESAGKFFHANINGKFESTKQDQDAEDANG